MNLKATKNIIFLIKGTGQFKEKSYDLNNYFSKKRVLLLRPYPSKNPINSKIYDFIFKIFRLGKSIDQNPKVKPDPDGVFEYLTSIKKEYKIDEITAISELDEEETKTFIKENNIIGMNFISDIDKMFITKDFEQKFEVILENNEVNFFIKKIR